jgi:tetratricopeptide (TPR) repeat protein
MNDFEKSILLNYYASFYLNTEDYAGAIGSFEETLEIETLREDARLRTLRQLGQLQAAEEKWEDPIKYYQQWRDLSLEEDDRIFRGLSYARSQLEQYAVETVNYASGSVYVGEFKDGNPTDKEPVILSYSN